MKQPLWILNSSLLVVFLLSQSLLFLLQKTIPARVKITPGEIQTLQQESVSSVDVLAIYQNDLFNTYVSPKPTFEKIDDAVAPIPDIPQSIEIKIPTEKTPTFFAPLEVLLKGIIFVGDDPSSSLAIIQDKKSKEESNYQVGDLIEDAQVLKILSNRVIIIRSNGQQETLYLREEDAQNEFETEVSYLPKDVVEKQQEGQYRINLDEFTKRIQSLGEFINLLDLTTVYHQGQSIGCRVGKISKDSLGSMLGFAYDDIITSVESIPATDLQNRIKIYDQVVKKSPGDTVSVQIERGTGKIEIQYALIDSSLKRAGITAREMMESSQLPESDESSTSKTDASSNSQPSQSSASPTSVATAERQEEKSTLPMLDQKTLHDLEEHKKRLLSQREKMAPTLRDMAFQERMHMLQGGKKNAILNGVKK